MTAEETRGGNEIDRFPIGMRVLAVDDDPLCLKVLEALLRKCQYQVTTTNQAITALKMLRENRNRFDLVISDVYMPDMDGFKLLELVGLEMDLPVIMLSGNSDPKLVMKGITHGACDYLVKPVRLEELCNIWQHVIRRKVESTSKSNNNEKSDQGNEGGEQNVNKSRKRKDGDDDDDDEEENGHDSDDSSTQKKPRVVWSIDLHRKFVTAVNQLGIEKAVPKRILDLMNVDGLTRENVASHLQKYRLYLKRISHQANMVVAFGNSNDASSYMRTNPLDGHLDFRSLSSSSGRLPNGYSPAGMLSRLNSATGVTLHSLTGPPNLNQNKLQPLVSSSTPSNQQNMSLFQGIPPSFDLDLQQYGNKPNTQLTDFGSVDESRIFTGTKLADFNSIDESRIFTGSSTFTNPNAVGSESSLKRSSIGSESFNLHSSSNPIFLDQNSNPSSSFSSNQLSIGENYSGGLVGDIVRNVHQFLPNQNQKNGNFTKQDYSQYSQNAFSTLASSALASGGGGLSGSVSQNRPNGGLSGSMRSSEDYLMDQTKLQGGFSGYGSLDDIMNGMMKREQDPMMIMAGEFGYDPYGFGS